MKQKLIPAPIDNKNLMEDPLEDEIFADFLDARDHHVSDQRHKVGFIRIPDEAEAYVDVTWNYGSYRLYIRLLAANPCMADFISTRDIIFKHYSDLFTSWQCDDNPGLVVNCATVASVLIVTFYFKDE